jgi:hypothetical protein
MTRHVLKLLLIFDEQNCRSGGQSPPEGGLELCLHPGKDISDLFCCRFQWFLKKDNHLVCLNDASPLSMGGVWQEHKREKQAHHDSHYH